MREPTTHCQDLKTQTKIVSQDTSPPPPPLHHPGERGLPAQIEDGVQREVRREVRGRGEEGLHDDACRGMQRGNDHYDDEDVIMITKWLLNEKFSYHQYRHHNHLLQQGGGARVRVCAEGEVRLGAKGAVPGGEHRRRH